MMKIGVIGGNGVAATNRLLDMLERKLTLGGAFRDAHHPEMVVLQATSAPSRSMYLEGRGPNWIPDYVSRAIELKRMGCDIACICCNTAHYAIDEIRRRSGMEFVNLLDEVAKACLATGESKFEMFCSDGARKAGLYTQAFGRHPPLEVVYPPEERQRLVTRAICAVKSSARFLPDGDECSPRTILMRLAAEARHPVVFGCTDLRVAFDPGEALPQAVAVDSLEVLADCLAGNVSLPAVGLPTAGRLGVAGRLG